MQTTYTKEASQQDRESNLQRTPIANVQIKGRWQAVHLTRDEVKQIRENLDLENAQLWKLLFDVAEIYTKDRDVRLAMTRALFGQSAHKQYTLEERALKHKAQRLRAEARATSARLPPVYQRGGDRQ